MEGSSGSCSCILAAGESPAGSFGWVKNGSLEFFPVLPVCAGGRVLGAAGGTAACSSGLPELLLPEGLRAHLLQ